MCMHEKEIPWNFKLELITFGIQIRLENPSYPSTRLSVRVPSLGFHFSPARYHRLMRVAKIFQEEGSENSDLLRPWNQSDFEGWLSLLIRKVFLSPTSWFCLMDMRGPLIIYACMHTYIERELVFFSFVTGHGKQGSCMAAAIYLLSWSFSVCTRKPGLKILQALSQVRTPFMSIYAIIS